MKFFWGENRRTDDKLLFNEILKGQHVRIVRTVRMNKLYKSLQEVHTGSTSINTSLEQYDAAFTVKL